jgi:LmbE family N-acetylglucosaminyl deacetylase
MVKKILLTLLIILLILLLLVLAAPYLLRPLFSYGNKPADLKKAKELGDELLAARNKTFVIVVAHPDDAEWYAGGTLASLAQNNKVVLVMGTSGEKGANTPNLGKLREQKQKEAGKTIGYSRIIFLRFPDRGLKNNQEFRNRLHAIFEEEKPEAILTFDFTKPNYIYRHSDHMAAGDTALAVGKSFPGLKYYLFHSRATSVVVEFEPVKEKKRQALQIVSDYGPPSRHIGLRILRFLFQTRDGGEPFEWYGMRERYPEIGVQFGEVFRKGEVAQGDSKRGRFSFLYR